MTAFPLLESLAESAPFALGQRIAVAPGFIASRAPSSALVLPLSASRSRCIIEQLGAHWWVRDLGGVDGVFHNGARLTGEGVALLHQDVLELAPGLPFVFLQREQMPAARSDALEAAIAANPDDGARWQVYADWLLEHQSPLGEAMTRDALAPERRGQMLGALAMMHDLGACEIEWRFGLPAKVVLRNPSEVAPIFAPQHLVDLLRGNSAFRFMRALEVDVRSFGSGALVDAYVESVLEQLATGRWPMLERVVFGPMARRELQRPQLIALEALKARVGALKTTADQLFVMAQGASLAITSVPQGVTLNVPTTEPVQLNPHRSNLVGGINDCLVVALGAPVSTLAVQFENELDRWWVTDLAATLGVTINRSMKVNGRAQKRAQLRDGDLLELVPNLRVRFHLPMR